MLPNQDGIPSLVYVPYVWDDDDREEWDGLSIPMRFGYGDGFLRMPSDHTPVVPIHCTWYTPDAKIKHKETPICMVDAADPSYLVVFYVAEKWVLYLSSLCHSLTITGRTDCTARVQASSVNLQP